MRIIPFTEKKFRKKIGICSGNTDPDPHQNEAYPKH